MPDSAAVLSKLGLKHQLLPRSAIANEWLVASYTIRELVELTDVAIEQLLIGCQTEWHTHIRYGLWIRCT